MEVYEAIRSRVAIKEFRPDPIPQTVIRRILLAARWAPSQRNRQPWHFIVVDDKNTLTELGTLASSGTYIAEAPLAIAVAMEEGARNIHLDSGRVIENMLLTAWADGVGTSYVGQIERDKAKKLLQIPAGMDLITIMPYGYPTEAALAKGKRRKSLSEIAHKGYFGQPFE